MNNCCFNCQYWKGPKNKIAERIKNDPRAIAWSENGQCDEIKLNIEVKFDFDSDSDVVLIETNPDFCCNKWESDVVIKDHELITL